MKGYKVTIFMLIQYKNLLSAYLEGQVSHRLGKIVGLETVPIVQMLPYAHSHLHRNCK